MKVLLPVLLLLAVSLGGCTLPASENPATTVTQTVTAPAMDTASATSSASPSATATQTGSPPSSSTTTSSTSTTTTSTSSAPAPGPGFSGTFYFHQLPDAPPGYVGTIDATADADQGDLVGRYGPGGEVWSRFMYLENDAAVHIAGTATFNVGFQGYPDEYDPYNPVPILKVSVTLDGVETSGTANYGGATTATVALPEGDYTEIDVAFCICSLGDNAGNYRVNLGSGTYVVFSG